MKKNVFLSVILLITLVFSNNVIADFESCVIEKITNNPKFKQCMEENIESDTNGIPKECRGYLYLETLTVIKDGELQIKDRKAAKETYPNCINTDKNLTLKGNIGIENRTIIAQNNEKEISKQTTTDENGNFNLNLPKGTYTIKSPNLGGKNIQLSDNKDLGDISLKRLEFRFEENIIPGEINAKIYLTNNNIPIISTTLKKPKYINIRPGTYDIRIYKSGLGKILEKESFNIGENKTLELNLSEKLLTLEGNVTNKNKDIENVHILASKEKDGAKITKRTKTDGNGNFEMKLLPGKYNIKFSKKGFKKLEKNIELKDGKNLGDIKLEKINKEVNVNIKLNYPGKIQDTVGFISLQGRNLDEKEKNELWFGKEIKDENISFNIPKGANRMLNIKGDKIKNIQKNIGKIEEDKELSFILEKTQRKLDQMNKNINNSGGGSVEMKDEIKMKYPKNAFGKDIKNIRFKIKETKNIPTFLDTKHLGEKGYKLNILNQNKEIRKFDKELTVKFSYNGKDLLSTFTGLTVKDLRNLQVYYFDPKVKEWLSHNTDVKIEGKNIEDIKENTLIKNIENFEQIKLTLSIKTNHFTLFSSLVSTAAKNSEKSLKEGAKKTVAKISNYLGDIKQSIKSTSEKNIKEVVSITRDNEKIDIEKILKEGTKGVKNIQENLVSFGVGDIIETKNGSIEITLSNYTNLNIKPGSTVKFLDAKNNKLSYKNVEGEVNYDFENKKNKNFNYEVHGKNTYATIRGTTLQMISDAKKDVYHLIEGKLDITNTEKDKVITLNEGEKYISYTNGEDKLIKNNSKYVNTNVGKVKYGVYKSADLLYKENITKLRPDNAPYFKELKRREAALLMKRFARQILDKQPKNNNCSFNDIDNLHPETQKEIKQSCKLGLFKGFKGNFMPYKKITKGQAIMVFARLLSGDPSKEMGESYQYLLNNGIIQKNDMQENGYDNIKRKEIYKIINNALNRN